MFIREVKTNHVTYLQIIHAYRKNGKVKQKCIASLGSLEHLKQRPEQLQNMAHALLSYGKENPHFLDFSTAEEKNRKRWGAVVVFQKIWDQFGLTPFLQGLIKDTKVQFHFFSAVFLQVLDRLLDPKSRKRSQEEQHRYAGVTENALQHLFRALDRLADSKEGVEEYLFRRNLSLFNLSVNVVLYDVTTLYFESVQADRPDEKRGEDFLKEFGYSKDGKNKEVQILLGLLVDLEGRPIGFDLFSGNTFEGKTLKKALEKLNQRFHINKVMIMADQGMLSKDNVKLIKEAKYDYVIGGCIRKKSRVIQAKILDPKGYVSVTDSEKNQLFRYKRIPCGKEKLIVTWSQKRAQKDKKDRERSIEKAKKILEKGGNQVVSRRGALKYIQFQTHASAKLDEARIKEEEKWDGYFGIQTNEKELSAEKLLKYYHDLWRVEESFRIFKSHLETRPMFVWTPKRIKGHMVLCFIAFLLERTLEIELKKNKIEYSPEKIRKALDDLQYSEIQVEGQTFYLRSPIEGLANDILRTLHIKIPPKMTTPENFWRVS